MQTFFATSSYWRGSRQQNGSACLFAAAGGKKEKLPQIWQIFAQGEAAARRACADVGSAKDAGARVRGVRLRVHARMQVALKTQGSFCSYEKQLTCSVHLA